MKEEKASGFRPEEVWTYSSASRGACGSPGTMEILLRNGSFITINNQEDAIGRESVSYDLPSDMEMRNMGMGNRLYLRHEDIPWFDRAIDSYKGKEIADTVARYKHWKELFGKELSIRKALEEKIDIRKYIKSETVLIHWKDIRYIPGAFNTLFLVCFNEKNLPLSETDRDLSELSTLYPDYRMPDVHPCKGYTLKEYVEKYIECEKNLIRRFYDIDEANGEYFYTVRTTDNSRENEKAIGAFHSIEEVMKDAGSEFAQIIIKRYFERNSIEVMMDNLYRPVLIVGGSGTKEDDELIHSMSGMYVDFPLPFRTGDIVYGTDFALSADYSMILIKLPVSRDYSEQDDFLRNLEDISCTGELLESGEETDTYGWTLEEEERSE